jgi:hypothetical protein
MGFAIVSWYEMLRYLACLRKVPGFYRMVPSRNRETLHMPVIRSILRVGINGNFEESFLQECRSRRR